MSAKSTPGDGSFGKGTKGGGFWEPPQGAVAFMRDLARGLKHLRRR